MTKAHTLHWTHRSARKGHIYSQHGFRPGFTFPDHHSSWILSLAQCPLGKNYRAIYLKGWAGVQETLELQVGKKSFNSSKVIALILILNSVNENQALSQLWTKFLSKWSTVNKGKNAFPPEGASRGSLALWVRSPLKRLLRSDDNSSACRLRLMKS
jgi:hypothetical protein